MAIRNQSRFNEATPDLLRPRQSGKWVRSPEPHDGLFPNGHRAVGLEALRAPHGPVQVPGLRTAAVTVMSGGFRSPSRKNTAQVGGRGDFGIAGRAMFH